MTRRAYSRLSQDRRRTDLLEATLSCVADLGLDRAGARQIAERAGVSAGLIRHYFPSKDEMVRAAYAYLMGQMTAAAEDSGAGDEQSPEAALAEVIAANFAPPNLSGVKVSLWATFVGRVRVDPAYADIHREGYREFLDLLEARIHPVLVAQGGPADPSRCKQLAIALNGLIDGLWIEGSLGHGLYDARRLPAIALGAAEGILRLPDTTLTRHLALEDERS
ncbi:TetR family transcriptional regulator C-terminal domain-containing protein [Salipiger bermudensis]|uniref:TetR family transcriptional regulator C-terminal domain-containing protein n=1 Tax=Salipiger bermudensis TaxID=344736 RepID=UPI00300BC3FE